jgi:hypothetical protein
VDIVKLDRKIGLLTAAMTVAAAGSALGQISPATQPSAPSAEAPDAPGAAGPPIRWMPLSRFGMTLAGGGGITDFTQSGTRSVTQTGESWDVRMAFRTRRWVGLEFSYIGGANVIHSLGFESGTTRLIRNGIELALRLNAPLYARDTLLEPYFAGGMGWNSYRITNTTTVTADASPTGASTLALPLAIGFAIGYKGFIADARCTLRPTYRQTTLRDEGSGALTNWDLGGMIGFEF